VAASDGAVQGRLQAEVVAGGGEHSVDGVAAGIGKVIAAHAVMFLEMADDGLNGGTTFELALDLRRDAARGGISQQGRLAGSALICRRQN